MNVNKVMLGLYEAHAQLKSLAAELQAQPTLKNWAANSLKSRAF